MFVTLPRSGRSPAIRPAPLTIRRVHLGGAVRRPAVVVAGAAGARYWSSPTRRGDVSSPELNNRHRDTLEKIFRHPASGNVEWRQVVSLLEAVGTVEEDGADLKVRLGTEFHTLRRPRNKDVDKQMIVDLRRMLTEAGLNPPER